MAPLPPNTTGVLTVTYSGDFGIRSFQFRNAATTPLASHINNVADFIEAAFGPFWYADVQVTGATYSELGSLISLPVAFPQIEGQATGTQNPADYPEFLSIVGRGRTNGRRLRLSVYGLVTAVTDNYRQAETETVIAQTVLPLARDLVLSGSLATIDGDAPVLYAYLNAGFNAYHQRKARRTA